MEVFMYWEQQSLLFWIILNIITASLLQVYCNIITDIFLLETFSIT